MSEETIFHRVVRWIHPKNDESNIVAATFHMIIITLISISIIDPVWYYISGNVCVPFLTLGQFFWFGYSADNTIEYSDYECINVKIVNFMRITILLCFMTIMFSLMGFFLEIIGSSHFFYRLLRKFAVMGICTLCWVMTTLTTALYISFMLEDNLDEMYPKANADVTYGVGFYLIAASGVISVFGVVYSLMLPYITSIFTQSDDRCLLEGLDDSMDVYRPPTPPPPYCIPPPPYSP